MNEKQLLDEIEQHYILALKGSKHRYKNMIKYCLFYDDQEAARYYRAKLGWVTRKLKQHDRL